MPFCQEDQDLDAKDHEESGADVTDRVWRALAIPRLMIPSAASGAGDGSSERTLFQPPA